jgi:hypothetical protein
MNMTEWEREAILWRMIKAQGGRVLLDMTPPPEGFVIISQPSRTSAQHWIFIAEVVKPDEDRVG